MKKKPGSEPAYKSETSTRQRKGLFGRQITVRTEKFGEGASNGVNTVRKTRTVENKRTGKVKSREVEKTNVPYRTGNTKYKTITKSKSGRPIETSEGTTTITNVKTRGVRKANGKTTRARNNRVDVSTRPKTGEIDFKGSGQPKFEPKMKIAKAKEKYKPTPRPKTGEIKFR
jgi:hypothetical protein